MGQSATTELAYRVLPAYEWPRLLPLVKHLYNGYTPPFPNPDSSVCWVAEDGDGDIVGYCFQQIVVHIEPFGCLSGHGVSLREFHRHIEDGLEEGTWIVANVQDYPRARAAAERNGMMRIEGCVPYQKQVVHGEGV